MIPRPAILARKDASFTIQAGSRAWHDPLFEQQARELVVLLAKASTFELPVKPFIGMPLPASGIIFHVEPDIKPEGYRLDVSSERVLIAASDQAGAFHAVQTIKQLLGPAIDAPASSGRADAWHIPCLSIDDRPRLSWRGFMLDVARHFFEKEIIKQILDVMALLKMNVFHWHLTDDQGWRIEIKRYPRLVEIGSKRGDSQVGGYVSLKRTGIPHEGYYTQDDAREIVAYARERFITVVPEIEFPGHCTAAIAAYPELHCKGKHLAVPATFVTRKGVVCAGKERVYEFIADILDEVLDIFPSKVIHVGGDETSTGTWKHCPDCKALMQREGLHSIHGVQPCFTSRVGKLLSDRGRTLMGWNEVLSSNLPADAIVQFWTGRTRAILPHLTKGRKFVMSPFFTVYLDHDHVLLPLDMVYNFDPVPKNVSIEQQGNVLGIEAPLWTEWVRTTRRLHWQLFPRLLAVAEAAWTPPNAKDYPSFKERLARFIPWLQERGINPASLDKVERCKLRKPLSFLHLFFEPRIPET